MKSLGKLLLLSIFCAFFGASLSSYATELGALSPDFKLPTNKGKDISLSEHKGKVIVIDFWTAWCGKCQKSLNFLNALQNKLQGKNFQVITVNLDETPDDALAFLAKNNLNLIVAYDPQASTPASFKIEDTPTSLVIDADGKIAMIHSGFDDEAGAELENKIQALLGK